jgi:hypothetical protein
LTFNITSEKEEKINSKNSSHPLKMAETNRDSMNLVNKGLDNLTFISRAFYERAYLKMFLSIIYFAAALFYLGLCAYGKFDH